MEGDQGVRLPGNGRISDDHFPGEAGLVKGNFKRIKRFKKFKIS
jgi:hypothetical protein